MNRILIVILSVLSALLICGQKSEVLEKNKIRNSGNHYTGIEMYGRWNEIPNINMPRYSMLTLYPNHRIGSGGKVYVYNLHESSLESGNYEVNSSFDTITLIPKCDLEIIGHFDNPRPLAIKQIPDEPSYYSPRKFVRSKNGDYVVELRYDFMASFDSICHLTKIMMDNGDTTGLSEAEAKIHKETPFVPYDTLWRIQVEQAIK